MRFTSGVDYRVSQATGHEVLLSLTLPHKDIATTDLVEGVVWLGATH